MSCWPITAGRSEHRSGKVDELYEIIKSAKSATESDARVRPVPHDASRFQDASEVELPERAEQGKLFPLTETIELGDAAQEQTPSYDEDYAKLSEKIEKGELDFAEETENEGQISIVDELWPDELKAGSTRAIDEELKSVFGMLDEDHYADPDGPDPKQKKREKRPPREEPADAFEYTSREQNAEIGSMLKKAVKQSRLRLAGVLFFALATLYLALAAPDSAIHSDFLRPGRYGIVYILVDLQVLLFIAALSLSSIKSGAKALFTWRPTSDSVLFFTFAVSIAYSLLAAFIAPTSESFVPFSLFAAAAGRVRGGGQLSALQKRSALLPCRRLQEPQVCRRAAFGRHGGGRRVLQISAGRFGPVHRPARRIRRRLFRADAPPPAERGFVQAGHSGRVPRRAVLFGLRRMTGTTSSPP